MRKNLTGRGLQEGEPSELPAEGWETPEDLGVEPEEGDVNLAGGGVQLVLTFRVLSGFEPG